LWNASIISAKLPKWQNKANSITTLLRQAFEESKLVWKTDTLDQAKDHLKKVCELLNDYSGEWNSEEIKSVIWDYAESVGRGSVLWPMRYALSGRDKSPDPFILADILGKDETLKRLQSHIV
jgi:glutamyl-tRNA synthetase